MTNKYLYMMLKYLKSYLLFGPQTKYVMVCFGGYFVNVSVNVICFKCIQSEYTSSELEFKYSL